MIMPLLALIALPAAASGPPATLGIAVHNNLAASVIEPVPRGMVDGTAGGHAQRILAAQKRYAAGKVIEPEKKK